MVIQWNDAANVKLLKAILRQNPNFSNKLAAQNMEKLGEKGCTPKAVTHQLRSLRQSIESAFDESAASGPTPSASVAGKSTRNPTRKRKAMSQGTGDGSSNKETDIIALLPPKKKVKTLEVTKSASKKVHNDFYDDEDSESDIDITPLLPPKRDVKPAPENIEHNNDGGECDGDIDITAPLPFRMEVKALSAKSITKKKGVAFAKD